MPPDFGRDVHCLLGLPIDAVDLRHAEARLVDAIDQGKRCFLSTPNLNFLIASQHDVAFRHSVLSSDLSVADGMPLVWLSWLLGIPIRERVAGSDLFERLVRSSKPIRVFFFGGIDGVAERACRQLNEAGGPATCVGFESPGFGSIPEMSSNRIIAKINACNPDFVVVSLGAKKGQAWIEHNRERLAAPLVSHLGAVVNFVAGTVGRAPTWFQRLGVEWLWRIKEEPALWRRYLGDAVMLVRLLLVRVLPLAFHRMLHSPDAAEIASARIESRYDSGIVAVTLTGAWTHANLSELRRSLARVDQANGEVVLDMAGVSYVDSAALGLLLLLYGGRTNGAGGMRITAVSRSVERIVRYSGAGYLLEFVDDQQ